MHQEGLKLQAEIFITPQRQNGEVLFLYWERSEKLFILFLVQQQHRKLLGTVRSQTSVMHTCRSINLLLCSDVTILWFVYRWPIMLISISSETFLFSFAGFTLLKEAILAPVTLRALGLPENSLLTGCPSRAKGLRSTWVGLLCAYLKVPEMTKFGKSPPYYIIQRKG